MPLVGSHAASHAGRIHSHDLLFKPLLVMLKLPEIKMALSIIADVVCMIAKPEPPGLKVFTAAPL